MPAFPSDGLFTNGTMTDTSMIRHTCVNADGLVDGGRGDGRRRALPDLQPLTSAENVEPREECLLHRIMAAPTPGPRGQEL